MTNARTLLLLASALAVGAAAGNAAPPPLVRSPVRAELLRLLERDAQSGGPAGGGGAAPAQRKSGAVPASLARSAPAEALGQPWRPELWAYFTDTGILASGHGKKMTRELTFGPCTDGELLNQRYYW